MIAIPGFDPGTEGFWEIGEDGFKQATKATFDNPISGKKPITRYVAESTSVLLIEKKHKIYIVVGRLVSDNVLQNVMGYAMKQSKYLEIQKCETLDNLRSVDRMVVLCNEFVELAQPRLADIPLDEDL
jgi:hypothetical protein